MMFGQTQAPKAGATAPAPKTAAPTDLVAWYAAVANEMITRVGRYPNTNVPILTLGVAGGLRKVLDTMTGPAREIADSIGSTFPGSQKNAETRFYTAYDKYIGPSGAKVLATVTAQSGSPIEMASLATQLAAKEAIPVEAAKAFWDAAGRYAIHLKVYQDRPVESKYVRAWNAFKEAFVEAPGVIAYYIDRTVAYAAEIAAMLVAAVATGAAKGVGRGLRPLKTFLIGTAVVGGLALTGFILYKATRPRVRELPAHEGA